MQLQKDPIVNSIYTCLFILYIERTNQLQYDCSLWRKKDVNRTTRLTSTDCTIDRSYDRLHCQIEQ